MERYEQVVRMFNSGQSQVAIARAMRMGRKTIRRLLRSGQFPEQKLLHRRPPKVNQFAEVGRQTRKRLTACQRALHKLA